MTTGFVTLRRSRPWRPFLPIIRHGQARLKRSQWQQGPGIQAADAAGREYTVDHIAVRHLPAPPEVAAEFGPVPVIERVRRYSHKGVPVMFAASWYPVEYAAGTAVGHEDTGPGGAPARLAERGFVLTHAREAVTARLPTDAEAAELELTGQAQPVFQIMRHSADQGGRLVEVSKMILHAAQYTLLYDIEA
jgi:GntR family transcriptional regulator